MDGVKDFLVSEKDERDNFGFSFIFTTSLLLTCLKPEMSWWMKDTALVFLSAFL